MSKPIINGSARIGAYTYIAGQEDQLAAVASPEEIKRLTEKGVISGDFGKAPKSAEPVGEPASEGAKSKASDSTETAATTSKSSQSKATKGK